MSTPIGLSRGNRNELETALRRVSGRGGSVIVGWRYALDGLEVLHVSSYDLPKVAKRVRNLLRHARFLAHPSDWTAALEAGCKASALPLSFGLREGPAIQEFVNDLVSRFSVTHYECRAVALFDMVSFSVHSPFEQITQINVLSNAILRGAHACKRAGMPIDIRLSTTGDGFYAWNQTTGLHADVALYCAASLAIAHTQAARRLAEPNTVPRLRACIGMGSHYEYYQGSGAGSEPASYIVGDVTIELARLISSALNDQLLIGDTVRKLEREDAEMVGVTSIDTPSFAALAQGELQRLKDVALPGGKIETIKSYLTGPRESATTFAIRKYYVTDKHGLEHGCYNAKLNTTLKGDVALRFGLLDSELEGFKGRWDPAEDIQIRVV